MEWERERERELSQVGESSVTRKADVRLSEKGKWKRVVTGVPAARDAVGAGRVQAVVGLVHFHNLYRVVVRLQALQS